MSRRVMNLAHMLTQNARRLAAALASSGATGPGPGARSTATSPRWRRPRRARHRQGRSRSRPFQEWRRDVLVDVRGLPAGCRLGADQFPPDAGRGRRSRHRSGAKGFLCHADFPDHAAAAANPALEFVWRIGEGDVRRKIGGRCDRRSCGRQGRERGGRLRRSLLVLLHLRHHRPLQGGGADPRPDGLCGNQSSRRPDARHDGDATPRWWSRRCRMAPACTS